MSEIDRAYVAWVDSGGSLDEPPFPRPYDSARELVCLAARVAELSLTEGERRILIELDGHKMLNDGERALIRRLLDVNRISQ